MVVKIKLGTNSGQDLGPFNLTANTGTVTPETATRVQLLQGLNVTVDSAATQVTVTSTGTCTNATTVNIVGIPVTKTYYELLLCEDITVKAYTLIAGSFNQRYVLQGSPDVYYIATGQTITQSEDPTGFDPNIVLVQGETGCPDEQLPETFDIYLSDPVELDGSQNNIFTRNGNDIKVVGITGQLKKTTVNYIEGSEQQGATIYNTDNTLFNGGGMLYAASGSNFNTSDLPYNWVVLEIDTEGVVQSVRDNLGNIF